VCQQGARQHCQWTLLHWVDKASFVTGAHLLVDGGLTAGKF
jgi:hypothetical protein